MSDNPYLPAVDPFEALAVEAMRRYNADQAIKRSLQPLPGHKLLEREYEARRTLQLEDKRKV